jgi:hypothetical protein
MLMGCGTWAKRHFKAETLQGSICMEEKTSKKQFKPAKTKGFTIAINERPS